jgi:hypothetical protein
MLPPPLALPPPADDGFELLEQPNASRNPQAIKE